MDGTFVSGYDVLMLLWGVAFLIGTVGFIFLMNWVFQSEERRQEAAVQAVENAHPSDHHPLRPAA